MQYINLLPIKEYISYLKSFEDFENMVKLHQRLSLGYQREYPFRRAELEWYFLFLLVPPKDKNFVWKLIEDNEQLNRNRNYFDFYLSNT